MTAYAAFQNPTKCFFQKWKEKVRSNRRMQNHATITKRQNAENLKDLINSF